MPQRVSSEISAPVRFKPSRRAIALEPRILFDGAAASAAAEAFDDSWDADLPEDAPAVDANPSDGAPAILVIIDARVADHEILSADLPANIIVRVIGEDESGLAVTGEALANGNNGQGFDAVHIISHGTPGSLTLGRDTVNNETLDTHSEQLQSWALYLTADADILLYGCDIAAGDEGEALITELAHLTEADIAASIDPTGTAEQGGNWTLEAQTGAIEAGVLFSEAAMAGYGGCWRMSTLK